MIFTFFIYFIILFSIVLLAGNQHFYFNKKNLFSSGVILITLYSLIIGLRYDVGVDYLSYQNSFTDAKYNTGQEFTVGHHDQFEPGFKAIVWILIKMGFDYQAFFVVSAFLQIFFLYLFSRQYKFLSPWLFFYFIASMTFFDTFNLIRQTTAFFMLLCCLKFIQQRKFLYFLLSIILISFFHKSIWIVLPFYFFVNRKIFSNKYITSALILFFFLFSTLLTDLIFNNLFPFLGNVLAGLDEVEYITNPKLMTEREITGLGIMRLIMISIDFIIIFFADTLRKYYKKINIEIFYNFFIFGQLIYLIAGGSITLTRLNVYFVNFSFILLAFISYMISRKISIHFVRYSIVQIYLILVSIAIFANAIISGSKNAPYQFVDL